MFTILTTVRKDLATVLSLDEFSQMSNNEMISLDSSWLYFVNV